jgi:hypothetical protein
MTSSARIDNSRKIRSPRVTELTARSWLTEAPLRMLMNNLDPEVAERPEELIVYGGTGRAARDWDCYDAIVRSLTPLADDETLLVQSGKPVGAFRTHEDAPRVLIANSILDHFSELDRRGLMMYGQMTAGSWIYIGSQDISSRAPTKLSSKPDDFTSLAAWRGAGSSLPGSAAWAAPNPSPRPWRAPRCSPWNAARAASSAASRPAIWIDPAPTWTKPWR